MMDEGLRACREPFGDVMAISGIAKCGGMKFGWNMIAGESKPSFHQRYGKEITHVMFNAVIEAAEPAMGFE